MDWYRVRARDLPWRRTRDAYAVWVSEAMCQQTQVATAAPYFERWMESFPTVEALAGADPEAVMAAWQGLGYYARGRKLQEGARWIVAHGWPRGAEAWRRVPGVGPYTAGALASIVDGEPAPLVDGNVERVAARVAGLDAAGAALRRAAWAWAGANVASAAPGDWNQALMELGATVCTPKRPRCADCPVAGWCVSFAEGAVGRRPAPRPRPPTVEVVLEVRVPRRADGHLGVRRQPEGGWWAGLWTFPWTRSEGDVPPGAVVVRTVVTRHRVRLAGRWDETGGAAAEGSLRWVDADAFETLAVPPVFRKLAAALARSPGLRFG